VPHARTVDLHHVPASHHGVQLTGRTVDTHPPGADQLVGAAAGRDAGARKVGIEAHAAILARVLRP